MIAKRGQLVALVRTRLDYVIGEGSTRRTSVELAVVSSVARDGIMRKVRSIGWGDTETKFEPGRDGKAMLIPQGLIDEAALIEAYRAHTYEGHEGQTKPFDTLDECREFVERFALETVK